MLLLNSRCCAGPGFRGDAPGLGGFTAWSGPGQGMEVVWAAAPAAPKAAGAAAHKNGQPDPARRVVVLAPLAPAGVEGARGCPQK